MELRIDGEMSWLGRYLVFKCLPFHLTASTV